MAAWSELAPRIATVRAGFQPILGESLVRYETAEMLNDDGDWVPWPDLPIRLYASGGQLVAVSWSKFDELSITAAPSLPSWVEGSTIRWVENSIETINAAVGKVFRSVMIGRGEMSIEGEDVEIWTRLMIQLDDVWLEVFNALDENGYDLHTQQPEGQFVSCI